MDNKVLADGQCLDTCPKGYYFENSKCLTCPLECKHCLSEFECLECSEGFYKFENRCLTICPAGTYENNDLQECSQCNQACVNCFGPTSNECITCDNSKGYIMSNLRNCRFITCSEGYYLNSSIPVQCLPCNHSCSTCNGPTSFDCLTCSKDFITNGSSKSGEGICVAPPEGYTRKPNGKLTGNSVFELQ